MPGGSAQAGLGLPAGPWLPRSPLDSGSQPPESPAESQDSTGLTGKQRSLLPRAPTLWAHHGPRPHPRPGLRLPPLLQRGPGGSGLARLLLIRVHLSNHNLGSLLLPTTPAPSPSQATPAPALKNPGGCNPWAREGFSLRGQHAAEAGRIAVWARGSPQAQAPPHRSFRQSATFPLPFSFLSFEGYKNTSYLLQKEKGKNQKASMNLHKCWCREGVGGLCRSRRRPQHPRSKARSRHRTRSRAPAWEPLEDRAVPSA